MQFFAAVPGNSAEWDFAIPTRAGVVKRELLPSHAYLRAASPARGIFHSGAYNVSTSLRSQPSAELNPLKPLLSRVVAFARAVSLSYCCGQRFMYAKCYLSARPGCPTDLKQIRDG